jgi:RHS repeat-associated protein
MWAIEQQAREIDVQPLLGHSTPALLCRYTATYDAVGNRLTESDTTHTYDDADQLTQAGDSTYTYDPNGNQVARGDDTFSYDYENRLTQATVGGTTFSFTYNGLGLQVSKTVGANTTDYVWSNGGSLPVVLYDGSYCVRGLGLMAKTDSQDGQLYYLADGLGSTTGLTDGQGSMVETYTYDVFGAIRSETGGQANDYRFTGQQLDVASDLYYLRARYYDPAIGRFPTRETLESASTMSLIAARPMVTLAFASANSSSCPLASLSTSLPITPVGVGDPTIICAD